jgi:hypothetical protein
MKATAVAQATTVMPATSNIKDNSNIMTAHNSRKASNSRNVSNNRTANIVGRNQSRDAYKNSEASNGIKGGQQQTNQQQY